MKPGRRPSGASEHEWEGLMIHAILETAEGRVRARAGGPTRRRDDDGDESARPGTSGRAAPGE